MIIYLSGLSRTWAPYAERFPIGLMIGPHRGWRVPWCDFAADNNVYANRLDPGWWFRDGQTRWYRMVEKISNLDRRPRFVVVPDVVADWSLTVEMAEVYAPHLRRFDLPFAIALQDGADFEEALRFDPAAVFVGGSTAWKWGNVGRIVDFFADRGIWIHVGRVNSTKRILLCRSYGVSSCDGSGFVRFKARMLPRLEAGVSAPCLWDS